MRHLKQVGIILLLVLVPVLSLALTDAEKASLDRGLSRLGPDDSIISYVDGMQIDSFKYIYDKGVIDLNKTYPISYTTYVNGKNEKQTFYKTPLIAVLAFGNDSMIQFVLDQKPDLNVKDSNGETALMHLFSHNLDFKYLDRFLKQGADVKVRDNQGQNILFHFDTLHYTPDTRYIPKDMDVEIDQFVVHQMSAENVEYQIDKMIALANKNGISVNDADNNGTTPLMKALSVGQKMVALKLLAAGAKVNQRDKKGQTALYYINWYKNSDLMAKMLIAWGADAGVKDNDGNTPLIKAAKAGQLEMMKVLYEKDPKVLNHKNKEGHTALDYAIQRGLVNTALFLKEQGAK